MIQKNQETIMNPHKTIENLTALDFSSEEARSLAILGNKLAAWYSLYTKGKIYRDFAGKPYFSPSSSPIKDGEYLALSKISAILENRNDRGKVKLTPKIFNDDEGFAFYLFSSWDDLILVAFQ